MGSQYAGAVNREGIVERLNQGVEGTLAALGFQPKREGRELLIPAVWRGDSGRPNVGIRPDTGQWVDRASVGDGGAFIELVARLLNLTNNAAAAELERRGLLRPSTQGAAPVPSPRRDHQLAAAPPPVKVPQQPNGKGDGLALLAHRWETTQAALMWLGAVAHEGRDGAELWFPRLDRDGNPTGCWQRRPAATATFPNGGPKAKASGPQDGILGRRPDAGTVRFFILESEHCAGVLAAVVDEDEAIAALSASATEAQLAIVAAWAALVPEVVILGHQDETGLALAERLARRIPTARIVTWSAEAENAKDIAEVLDPFGHDQYRQAVDRFVDKALAADAFIASRPKAPDAFPSPILAAIAAPATVNFGGLQAATNTATVDVVQSVDPQTSTAPSKAIELPEVFALYDLMQVEFPPLRWLWDECLPEGTLTLLAAPPKAGKSWFTLALALAVATGRPFMGRATRKTPVLYLSLEDSPRRLQYRARKVMQSLGIDPNELRPMVGSICPFNAMVDSKDRKIGNGLEVMISTALGGQPGLVIIDIFHKARMPARESSYMNDATEVSALAQYVRQQGITMIVIHHTRKAASDDFVEIMSGTNGIAGSVDSPWALLRKRSGDTGKLMATGRDFADQEIPMRFHEGIWTLGDESDELTGNARVISDLAEELGSVPFTVAQAAKSLEKSEGSTRKVLDRAVVAGQLRKVDRGRYAAPLE